MAHTKKIIIHDRGCGETPTGKPAEQIINPPIVVDAKLPVVEKSDALKPDTK